MGLKKELTESERSEIIEKLTEGWSYKRIGGNRNILFNLIVNLEFFDVSKSSVAFTFMKYREYRNLKTSERSGWPTKINNQDKRLLKRLSMQNPHNSCQEISAAFITSEIQKYPGKVYAELSSH